ncbi:MAG TPA: LacI family transcriptional regulator [Sphaerochaeta sp.]|nr:LacI family transcriptional regulator [Sphaerochaeta sp.]
MRSTRDSVAALAKVSSATVSRVYNNPESVSEDLRQRVFEAARILGYAPNPLAASLRRKGTGTLAFVEFNKTGRPYYWGSFSSFDWFFGRALRGVQSVIGQSSWQLRFFRVGSREELKLVEKQCDGILAYDVDTPQELSLFEGITIPSVLSHHIGEDAQGCIVRTDNLHGGILQGRYLKEMGCEKPLYITGYVQSVEPHAKRLEGFLRVYPQAVVISTTIGSPTCVSSILNQVEALLAREEIDGVAAVNDLTLFDLLMRKSMDLPAIGYDASPFSSLLGKRVASVDIQSGRLYQKATEKLLSMLAGKQEASTTILPHLVRDVQ